MPRRRLPSPRSSGAPFLLLFIWHLPFRLYPSLPPSLASFMHNVDPLHLIFRPRPSASDRPRADPLQKKERPFSNSIRDWFRIRSISGSTASEWGSDGQARARVMWSTCRGRLTHQYLELLQQLKNLPFATSSLSSQRNGSVVG